MSKLSQGKPSFSLNLQPKLNKRRVIPKRSPVAEFVSDEGIWQGPSFPQVFLRAESLGPWVSTICANGVRILFKSRLRQVFSLRCSRKYHPARAHVRQPLNTNYVCPKCSMKLSSQKPAARQMGSSCAVTLLCFRCLAFRPVGIPKQSCFPTCRCQILLCT